MNRKQSLVAAVALMIGLSTATVAVAQTIVLEQITLGLVSPVYVTHSGDGSGRLFIAEQAGVIRVWDGSQLLGTPFLDISSLVNSSASEQGLFSVAFHPDYETNGFFYVDYTDVNGDTMVERYTVSGNPNVADPTSAFTILALAQPAAGHNGGQLHFGPNDGYLYISLGDGGESGDPNNYAQSVNSLLGKILRIDVDSGSPYAIPPDNPYAGIAGLDEIWVSGFRNPWRFSFDRLTGDMFIGDVGERDREEISFQSGASTGCENYGWRRMEGSLCFNPAVGCSPGVPTGCNPTGQLELPILEYAHQNQPCDSVTGGYRYRGSQEPALDGMYIYGDYCTGEIWGAVETTGGDAGAPGMAPTAWTSTLLLDTNFFLSSFGEDEFGEVYVLEVGPGGKLYRIAAGPGFDLSVSGSCPGTASVTISGAPPNSEVGVVAAANTNGFTKGGVQCNGTVLEIGEPFQLPPTWIITDANGNGSANKTLPANRCWLEALALASCETSDAVLVP